jgi:tetratricopeptide (TPR) repeat protein
MLLERLKQEPPEHKPLPWMTLAILAIAVGAISFGILKFVSKPDVYASPSAHDTTDMAQKRAVFQPIIDSIKLVLTKNPKDEEATLHLANVEYDAGDWNESVRNYQAYLSMKPRDADARVDYAYAIAQQTGDIEKSLVQIDSALKFDPDHLNALVNAGILSTQMVSNGNHQEALKRSRSYFERAKALALKKDPAMAGRIDTLLMEIDKTGERLAKAPADSSK